ADSNTALDSEAGNRLSRADYFSISAQRANSTDAPSGSSATPTAARACRPTSPNTSNNNSEAPFNTVGCLVNPGDDATNPSRRTIRLILSNVPAAAFNWAIALMQHSRAARTASTSETSVSTLPW